MNIKFYYDIVCPYAYMAFTFLHRAGLFSSRKISLKPILLGGLFKEMDTDPNRGLSQSRKAYLREDLIRQANLFNVPFKENPRYPLRTLEAMRLITACENEDNRLLLTKKLYQANFRDQLDIENTAVLASFKNQFEIKDADIELVKDKLRKETHEAFQKKIFGVPTLMIDDECFFGADRLELVQEKLGITLNAPSFRPSEPIDFYFDFSSPYSFLAFIEVEKAKLAGTNFVMKPILLGALLKEIGTSDIPMLSAHPHKAAYYIKDMNDWARYRHARFTFNQRFPLRTVLALRVALVEPRAIAAIFKAAWADDNDISDDKVLQGVLDKAGFGKENLLERAQDERIKTLLKDNTEEALSRGVFGVPTFFVRNEMVFGQDRFLWIRSQI